MTTPHRIQEPSTRSTVVVRVPNPPTVSEISLDDLAAVTGGADGQVAHELTHVVQQAGR